MSPPPTSTSTSASTSTPRRNLKRVNSFANSSDTDYTPPKKKSRCERVTASVNQTECRLEELLRQHSCDPSDDTIIASLKIMNNEDQEIMYTTQKIIDDVKATVKKGIHKEGRKILEVELYLRWLEGYDFVITSMEMILNARIPGTRRRVPGFGRLSFSVLYHLVNGFIEEVNAHQDGWSRRYPVGPVGLDPLVMTLAEESKEPTADGRSEEAVKSAELILARYDRVFLAAVYRYKSECNKKLVATCVGQKEDNLAKGCCLLSEQTGFGGTDDMGFSLLVEARQAMVEWKKKFSSSGDN